MVSIEEKVKNVISATAEASCDLYHESYEDKVNKLLDHILKWQKKISAVAKSFGEMNDDLIADFNTLNFDVTLYNQMVSLKRSAAKLIASLKKSDLYPSTKTVVKELKLEYDNFVEFLEDYKLSRIPDNELINLINQLD